MFPGQYDPPVIYRGCEWPAITLIWNDISGNPIDLTGFLAFAQLANGTTLNPVITDPTNGVTTLSMSQDQSATLTLGKFKWDWIWVINNVHQPPSLFGEVVIVDPKTYRFVTPGP